MCISLLITIKSLSYKVEKNLLIHTAFSIIITIMLQQGLHNQEKFFLTFSIFMFSPKAMPQVLLSVKLTRFF